MPLIEQQEAVQGVKELFSLGDCYCDEYRIVGMLNSLPTQEIIHCKDCKFARMTVNGECKYCDIWFPDEKTYMPGDYFCGSAERRGEQDERDHLCNKRVQDTAYT